MTLSEFVKKYNGKSCEAGGSANALNQCVDLANAYIDEVLGLPKILWTDAKDFPSKAGDNYEFTKNTPTGVPQKGDLVVWSGNVGNGHGHIGIFLEGNASKFTSFDENWSKKEICQEENHYYKNILGWLRVKNVDVLYKKELTEIFNVLARYFPEEEIAIKYHPHYPCDKTMIEIGEVLPDYIPGELLYHDNIKIYISLFSSAITNFENGLAVSIADLITFKSDEHRNHLKEALINRSRKQILFPKSLDEFREILVNMKRQAAQRN